MIPLRRYHNSYCHTPIKIGSPIRNNAHASHNVQNKSMFYIYTLFVYVQGSINLITKELVVVGCKMELLPNPTTVHYHLFNGLSVHVHRKF
jgi:hypothetical protein